MIKSFIDYISHFFKIDIGVVYIIMDNNEKYPSMKAIIE